MRWLFIFLIAVSFLACKNNAKEIPSSIYGIGPYEKLTLEQINDSIMKIGMETFKQKCSSCHTMEYKNSGPDLSDVLARRQPEWIMNYFMNYDVMLQKDSITIKTNQKYDENCSFELPQQEAFAILEYFRIYQIWLHEFNAK
ncbi:MAG: c-type cytochrome [Vicingaceae bacterium]|nr:c-type cytochrome [Vicingaceae bacterium]